MNKITKIDFIVEDHLKSEFAKACKAKGHTMTWVLNQLVNQYVKVSNHERRKTKTKTATAVN